MVSTIKSQVKETLGVGEQCQVKETINPQGYDFRIPKFVSL